MLSAFPLYWIEENHFWPYGYLLAFNAHFIIGVISLHFWIFPPFAAVMIFFAPLFFQSHYVFPTLSQIRAKTHALFFLGLLIFQSNTNRKQKTFGSINLQANFLNSLGRRWRNACSASFCTPFAKIRSFSSKMGKGESSISFTSITKQKINQNI